MGNSIGTGAQKPGRKNINRYGRADNAEDTEEEARLTREAVNAIEEKAKVLQNGTGKTSNNNKLREQERWFKGIRKKLVNQNNS